MRFSLIDRVTDFEPRSKIVATKSLSLAEEYLADHFPRFPVMPGVLMLEAMTQSGAWLVRASEDFAHSIVLLAAASNVKFRDFVRPGQTLTVTAEWLRHTDRTVDLRATGVVAGEVAVRGNLVLSRYNLADEQPHLSPTDEHLKRTLRQGWTLLTGSLAAAQTVAEPTT